MITRRAFINGVATATGATVASWPRVGAANAGEAGLNGATGTAPGLASPTSKPSYPPLLQGIRGQHDGSFEVAHQMARQGRRDWGAPAPVDAPYDLVVVGAGLSGLSAALFFQQRRPGSKVLILDNHDDFGGHARRNEFVVDGRTILGTGGSQSIVNFAVDEAMSTVFEAVGVDLDVFENGAYDKTFFERHGLTQVWHFDEQTYGRNLSVPMAGPLGFNVPFPSTPPEESIAQMPLSDTARQELLALYRLNEDRTKGSIFSEMNYLKRITYQELLQEHCGITQPELLDLLGAGVLHAGFCVDNAPADFALTAGMPGIGATSLRMFRKNRLDKLARWFINYVHHFPDGNAGVARLLVRHLIPEASDGKAGMESIVTAPVFYDQLDNAGAPVRLRLNSTVVGVSHDGTPESADAVDVTYIGPNGPQRVRSRYCVLACQNRVIPHLWRELPTKQAEALRGSLRSPIFYSNVVLRRWDSLKSAGIGAAFSPGCLHSTMVVDLPVSLGDYRFARQPDEPIVLYMGGSTLGAGPAIPSERFKTQRYQLLGMRFEHFEADLRRQLSGMLGPHGFDFDRDVAGITVNRWSHGFTMAPNLAFDGDEEAHEARLVAARQPLGRVAIANCDAAALGLQQGSYSEAWRAVNELLT